MDGIEEHWFHYGERKTQCGKISKVAWMRRFDVCSLGNIYKRLLTLHQNGIVVECFQEFEVWVACTSCQLQKTCNWDICGKVNPRDVLLNTSAWLEGDDN